MKKVILLFMAACFVSLTACGNAQKESQPTTQPQITEAVGTEAPQKETQAEEQPREEKNMTLQMTIDGTPVAVEWEDNEAVQALTELCKNQPLTIDMSMYGGFEQVGFIGTNLPQNDVQTTTAAGDIVLYFGNQLVVFYGSNSWAYTRLGHITDQSAEGMTLLLSNGNVTVTLTCR